MNKPEAAVVYRGKTYTKGFVEPGRNRPCPCESGKKWKNCCMDKMEAPIREALVEAGKKCQSRTAGTAKRTS